jgi:hypothetical protein
LEILLSLQINVKVKTGSKISEIKSEDEGYTCKLKAKPIEGKANQELIKALAKYFRTTQDNLVILKGIKSKNKVIRIEDDGLIDKERLAEIEKHSKKAK